MKIGVMICSYYLKRDGTLPKRPREPSLEQTIRLTADLGLHSLELQDPGGGFREEFPDVPSAKRLKELEDLGNSLGVEIPVISAMSGNLLGPNTDREVRYVQKWLGLASAVGIRTLKINVGLKPPGVSAARSFRRAEVALTKSARIAEDYGVVLAPELWPPSYPTSDVHAMITLMKMIDSKYFRHTLDNYQLPADWAVAAYELLAPFTTHVHMSTRAWYDRDPSDSRFKFKEFVPALKRAGYHGYLMIEARPQGLSLPARMTQLREASEMLQSLVSS